VFLRDVVDGQTLLVSRELSGGTSANRASTSPMLSTNGRWLVFESTAASLVANDTNGASDVQRAKLGRTPFAAYFSEVIISVEAGVGKPDPELFRLAAKRLGVDPRDAVMVGDSLARDVAGAKAAGMRAVWLDRKLWTESETAQPDARIERLSDLPAALDALARSPASPQATS